MQVRMALVLATFVLAGCGNDPVEIQLGSSTATTPASTSPSTSSNTNVTTDAPETSAAPLAPGEKGEGFSMDATGCKELLTLVPIPMARAREFVPANYTPLGSESGQATALVGLKKCEDLVVNGTSVGPASTSDVGIFVDKGDPATFHYYQAWWTTDSQALWDRLSVLGWKGGVSKDALTPLGGLPIGSATAEVLYDAANYSFGGNLAAQSSPGDNHAVGWFDTPSGTMTVDKTLRGTRLGTGPGTVNSDGEAVTLLGATATGDLLWNEYDMDGVVDYV